MVALRGLVTGFEAFAGLPSNPAALLLPELSGGTGGAEVVTAQVPVSLSRLTPVLDSLLAHHRPDFVVALGLARNAAVVRVETMAVNAVAFSVPDNDGAVPPEGSPIDPEGLGGRAATWDAPAVAAAIRAAGVPARLSFHAGTHMCNHALYTLLGRLEPVSPAVPCGFLHLPYLPEQVVWMLAQGRAGEDPPSMGLAEQLAAVRAAVAATAARAAALR